MSDLLPIELMLQYFELLRGRVATLRAALAAGEFDVVRRTAHDIAGTAAPYGFPELTASGRVIDRNIATGRIEPEAIAAFIAECEAVANAPR